MGLQRVVITGFGVMAPNGLGREAFWTSLLDGRSGVGLISRFDTDTFRSKIAGEVSGFSLADFMTPRARLCRIARHTQLALAATMDAMKSAGLVSPHDLRMTGERMPVYVGVSSSAMDVIEMSQKRLDAHGPVRMPAHGIEASVPQQTARMIAEEFGIGNETHVISSACVSGMDAIIMAATRIQNNDYDMALAGGTDASLNALPFSCMDKAGLASRCNGSPAKASRPFDRSADSGVISEGAAMVVLESFEHAQARGVEIYCELSGWGVRTDHPGHMMSGMMPAMSFALANAGRSSRDVELICAHGPGHPLIDRMELDLLCSYFGDDIGRIPVTSIKGSIGNPLAAAGPMQVAATAMALRIGTIPHIHNLENPVLDSVDFVRDAPRYQRVNCAVANIHGLGGGNASVVLEQVRTL